MMILLMLVVFFPVSMATNAVHILTAKTVVIPGDTYHFLCVDPSHTALSVQWLVNGTLLENSGLMIVFQHFDSNITKTATLDFDLPLEYNVTTIQCIGNFASENVSSETITLLLQGLLPAVGFPLVILGNTEFSLTWTAPFTLDISNVDPDITYCVDVVNSTSSSIVLSECGITVTEFNFSVLSGRVCDNYTFTVTPVNRAGNGTAVTLGYSITVPMTREGLLLPKSEFTYQVTMSAPVCYGELIAINDYTEEETPLRDNDITMKTITFASKKLNKNQLYTVSVNVSNINGSAVSYVSLSTHDVMNTTFDVTSHTITTEYFEYSTAIGAFCIFIFINEDSSIDFSKTIYLPLRRNSSHNYTLHAISPGQYQMFVYDIDRNVTFHDGADYPAITNSLSINTQASYNRNIISSKLVRDCSATYENGVISAMCSYSNSSSVTGFQIIVQSNNITEVFKLYINGTTEHLSPGPVTVRVEENGTYQVAIFPVMGESGIADTTIAYSLVLPVNTTIESQTIIPEISKESSQGWKVAVGVVVSLGLLLLLIIIIIIIVYICKKVKDGRGHAGVPRQEHRQNLEENDRFRHLYDVEDSISTVQTLQDYGSSVPFMSPCGTLQDPSSAMTNIETCLADSNTGVHSLKSLHVALKPATNIFNDSNMKLVYLETKSSSDTNNSESDCCDVCKLGSAVTYANNVNECDSTVARVEIMSQNDFGKDRKLVDDRQCHSLNKVTEQHEENEQSQEKVPFSSERDPTGQYIVPSLPERKPTDPKKESTDKEIVPSSSKREPIDIKVVLKKESTDKEIVPSSLKREPIDIEVVLKKESTDKEIFFKNVLVDRRATMFIILLMFVMLLPISIATNDVQLFSTKTVGIPGDSFTFYCTDPSRTTLSVQWRVNGTLLENSSLVNVFQHFQIISKTAELSFNLHLEHNVTTIQCIGDFDSKEVPSENITLLLQGLLAAVGSPSVNLVGTDISLTWTAPFTLDISDVDPDIKYCVDVVNSTSSSTVLSECGITVTGFNFSIPLGRVCDNYTFTVTPVNRAGNGTAVTLGYSPNFSLPRASEELILPIEISTFKITMSAPVCYGELTAINDSTGDKTHIQVNITGNTITFTSEALNKNQLYTVSVNASNMNGSAVSYVSLSTHDVMNTTFDVTSHIITTEYFEYSTAMGALYIFIFINEDRSIDFKKSIYLPLDRSSSHNYTLPAIYPGQYQMFVYDIDSDVTFHDGADYPAITNNFSIISDNTQASYSRNTSSKLVRDCNATYENGVISAMCSYSNDSSVTGFQMIVQSNNVNKVKNLYINGTGQQSPEQVQRSPGPVTVQLEENGTYQVAIFPIMGRKGIVNTIIAYTQILNSDTNEPQTMTSKKSSQGWIAGVVVPLLLIIIVGVGIGYIYYRKHYLKKFLVIENNYVEEGHAKELAPIPPVAAPPSDSETSELINTETPSSCLITVDEMFSFPIVTGFPIIKAHCSTETNFTGMSSSSISSKIPNIKISDSPDSCIFADPTSPSIPPTTVLTQSTESKNNPSSEDSTKPAYSEHQRVKQAWENNSQVNDTKQSINYNIGESTEEGNQEAIVKQVLSPIAEGSMDSNTDCTIDSNTVLIKSDYIELSHSHLPGHTDLSVSCYDQEYGEIGDNLEFLSEENSTREKFDVRHKNKEEAYHILKQHTSSTNKRSAISAPRAIPQNLTEYFYECDFSTEHGQAPAAYPVRPIDTESMPLISV